MIRVEDVSFVYDLAAQPALRAVNLKIQSGEYIALAGPNGCGKTTLVKHLNGLLRPAQGDVWVDGENTRNPHSLPLIRQSVGMVFQNPDSQIVGMTVEEDVAFGPGNLRLPAAEIRTRVANALEQVGMAEFAKRAPHTLSSGEKQLVAVAGVLALRPRYLALDEPTAHLAPVARRRVLELIQRLHGLGMGIIHITHHMEELLGAARIVLMNRGAILQVGKPRSLFPKVPWIKSLGLEVPPASEMVWLLREAGAPLRPDILSLNEAAAEIAALLEKSPGAPREPLEP